MEAAEYVQQTTAVSQENGRDVVYVTGDSSASGWPSLYRYELGDVRAGGTGRFEKVGIAQNVPSFQGAGTIDSLNRLYIRTADVGGFPSRLAVWDLTKSDAANPVANKDIPVDLVLPSGTSFDVTSFDGMDYDGRRNKLVLWDGLSGTVWETKAVYDTSGNLLRQWVVTPVSSSTVARPDGNYATGVLGKWKFVPELGAFIALDNFASATGDAAVWIYKPIGWQNPGGNTPPTVTLTSPANGTSVAAPATVVVSANASDSDGSVSRVDFFAGATLIGSDTTAPYSITWSNVAAGSYALTAVAVDNGGASKTSSPVTLTVTAGATVTLQDGLNGYTGTRDAYLSSFYPSSNQGTGTDLLESASYADLVRFAIFQSEGGPVPNGATIVSATLSLYKSSYYDYTYQVARMLRNWDEVQVTWNVWRTGQPWSVAGATGAGTDYASVPDATVAAGWTPQWMTANVTTGVQAMSVGQPNNGWRLVRVSGNGNEKRFWSREYTGDPTLRPKLVVQYTVP